MYTDQPTLLPVGHVEGERGGRTHTPKRLSSRIRQGRQLFNTATAHSIPADGPCSRRGCHAEWSQAMFGNDKERGPLGPLKHLEKEARECQAAPRDVTEYADCLLLLLDASRRAGIEPETLVGAARAKLEVNKLRQWQKPTANGPVEHVREKLVLEPGEYERVDGKVVRVERNPSWGPGKANHPWIAGEFFYDDDGTGRWLDSRFWLKRRMPGVLNMTNIELAT